MAESSTTAAPRISHALADAKSKKGEDAPAAKPPATPDDVGAFAIFDGHGGKPFAHVCAHHTEAGIDYGSKYDVLARLLAAGNGKLPSQKDVEDIFWATDAEVGAALASAGAAQNLGGCTAQILMALPASGGLECMQAWVGDSTAVTVDMRSGTEGSVVRSTFNHNPEPDGQGESGPLLHMAAVSKACRKRVKKEAKERGEKFEEDEDEKEEEEKVSKVVGNSMAGSGKEAVPSAQMIRDVLKEMKHKDRSDEHVAMLLRAFEREKLILSYNGNHAKYRRSCFIYNRPKEKDENMPLTIHTTEDPFRKAHADMMMTRSLGDWKHVAWILPHPQVERFRVPPSAFYRTVIASDGLWDVVSHDLVAEITRNAPTAQEAAQKLVEAAKDVYLGQRGLELPGDDTTVMVVNLNPSQLEWQAPREQAAVCCSLM